MADGDIAECNGWVEDVLGVTLPEGSGAPSLDRPATGPVLPIWIAAKEELDGAVEELARRLRQSDDPDLREIGEFGLNGATNGESTRLMVALREADGSPSAASRASAWKAADAFRDFLDGAPIVPLIEGNTMGVTVPMRSVLGAALDDIQAALAG